VTLHSSLPKYNKSFVLMEYFGYLKRAPEQAGVGLNELLDALS
jgi:hypothetical protein